MLDPNHFFSANIVKNSSSLHKSKGILINSFYSLESEAIEELKRILPSPILPIGPLHSFNSNVQEATDAIPWLDKQSSESVLYVSFGNRLSLPKDQIQELASGLEQSGCNFLWVFKGSKVDRDDNEAIENFLEESFLQSTKDKGIVIKGWVNQERVLSHDAIGGFLSHCGWNSEVEAVRFGVPILAWPMNGDQKVNAEVVEKGGFGMKGKGWGQKKLIDGGEIAAMIVKLMGDEGTRSRAKVLKEEAQASEKTLVSLL